METDYNLNQDFPHIMCYSSFNNSLDIFLLEFLAIFGAKLWNEIPGRMRGMSKKVFKRKLISVLFGILKDNDDYLDATMIT